MFPRPLVIASLVGASIGVPYVMSNSSQGKFSDLWPFSNSKNKASVSSQLGGAESKKGRTSLYGSTSGTNNRLATQREVPFYQIADVFRMDITKEWVYQRWERKSTGLADPTLFGVRVSLVTGTKMSDLAGSLTYYFNAQGQAQHISFHGRTADTSQIIRFLTSRYGFQRMQAPPGEQLYQVVRSGRVRSELRTRPESVLRSSSPLNNYTVDLELERPGSNRTLPAPKPHFEIPKVASASGNQPPNPQNAAQSGPSPNGDSKADKNSEPKESYWDQVRAATAAERSKVLWRRWPN